MKNNLIYHAKFENIGGMMIPQFPKHDVVSFGLTQIGKKPRTKKSKKRK